MGKGKSVYYVSPSGSVIPCIVTQRKETGDKEVVVPQIDGGYKFLKMLGFETIFQFRRKEKNGKNKNRMD